MRDTPPPTITCPPNVSVATGPNRAPCDAPANWDAATATYNCTAAGQIAIKYYVNYGQPNQAEVHSGDVFALGTTTVTAKATDAATNSSTCTFTVTVSDTTPPSIICPPDVSAVTGTNRATCDAPARWDAATATDNCTPTKQIAIKYYVNYGQPNQAEVHSGDVFPVGTTTVTAQAADGAGNSGTCTFTVTVSDTTPPSII